MRNMMMNFRKSESGASLVEYAVALIVVTLVGGAGVLAVGNQGNSAVNSACTVANAAAAAAATAAGTAAPGNC